MLFLNLESTFIIHTLNKKIRNSKIIYIRIYVVWEKVTSLVKKKKIYIYFLVDISVLRSLGRKKWFWNHFCMPYDVRRMCSALQPKCLNRFQWNLVPGHIFINERQFFFYVLNNVKFSSNDVDQFFCNVASKKPKQNLSLEKMPVRELTVKTKKSTVELL